MANRFTCAFGLLLTLLSLNSCSAKSASEKNLIVFVGRKIEVTQVPRNRQLDKEFRAKYEVLELVYGNYTAATIEFVAYDHHGYPQFANYETVMLYVFQPNPFQYIHEKYQFHDVYRTANGQWAGCGDPYQYEPPVHRSHLTAQELEYQPLPIPQMQPEQLKRFYPPTRFDYRNNSIVCKKGALINQLFEVKRQGILKAREVFNSK